VTRQPPALTDRQLGRGPRARRPAPAPSTFCTCRGKSPRCGVCASQALQYHRGTLDERALDWAERSARARWDGKTWPPAPARWPPRQGRVADIAAAKVADLARDPGIAERLAVALHLRAKGLWERWQRDPAPPWVMEERRIAERVAFVGPAGDPRQREPRPKAR
jgi:hypothetical protein